MGLRAGVRISPGIPCEHMFDSPRLWGMEAAVPEGSKGSSGGGHRRCRAARAGAGDDGGLELHEVAGSIMADLAGVLNAAHGDMVRVMAEVMADGVWAGQGVLTPRQWLVWQTSLSEASATAVVNLARRSEELEATVAALAEGRLSLASAGLIARYVPAEFEASVLELAPLLTVGQLRRTVSRYQFDIDDPERGKYPNPAAGSGSDPAPAAGSDSAGDPDAGNGGGDGVSGSSEGATGSDHVGERGSGEGAVDAGQPLNADGPTDGPTDGAVTGTPGAAAGEGGAGVGGDGGLRMGWWLGREERREVSSGVDDDGNWWMSVHLPPDEGAVVAKALQTLRDDLFRQASAGLAEGDKRPKVSMADALLAMAEAALAAGEAKLPGTDRYQVHAHLESSPVGGNELGLHLGVVLPDHLRHFLTCDGRLRPVFERDGAPCSVGRSQRIVPRRLRLLIEQRDGGCVVPGCGRRFGLEVHHIVHWENGGETSTANLVTLCRKHHRDHHLGLLGIAGNADVGMHRPGGVCFANRRGEPIGPVGVPKPPPTDRPVIRHAADVGLVTGRFERPLGERLDPWAVHFKRRPKPEPTAQGSPPTPVSPPTPLSTDP